MRREFVLFAFLFFTVFAFSQSRKYNINLGNDNLGVLTVDRKIVNEIETLKIESNAKLDLFFLTKDIYFFMESSYTTNSLMYAKTLSKVNGELKEKSETKKNNKVYSCTNENGTKKITENIIYSVARLYFEEPEGVQQMYSERHVQFVTIRKVKDHLYELNLPNGGVNHYTYKNGVLISMTSERMGFELKFELI